MNVLIASMPYLSMGCTISQIGESIKTLRNVNQYRGTCSSIAYVLNELWISSSTVMSFATRSFMNLSPGAYDITGMVRTFFVVTLPARMISAPLGLFVGIQESDHRISLLACCASCVLLN